MVRDNFDIIDEGFPSRLSRYKVCYKQEIFPLK